MFETITLIIIFVLVCVAVFLLAKNHGQGKNNISEELLIFQKDMRKEFEAQERMFQALNEQIMIRQKENSDSSINFFTSFSSLQKEEMSILQKRLEDILKNNALSMQQASLILTEGLKNIQDSNEKKLDSIKQTVDEKLSETLNKRFNESFSAISAQMDALNKGIGEMQTVASSVGNLQNILTNVKNRGGLGEVQLGAILEQMLAPNQYERNVATKKSSQERVDYAVIFPGKNDEKTLLPIDSKFPVEDYQRICDASEQGNKEEVEKARKELSKRILLEAKSINEKYINLPYTTDFAIMFLPTEGLYSEILKVNGLFEKVQSEYKILICGPTNLMAILSSLQMGFRTLSIEKRTSEVWKHLSALKQEFGKFVGLLEKTQKKISEASDTIALANKSNVKISKTLSEVSSYGGEETLDTVEQVPQIGETTEE